MMARDGRHWQEQKKTKKWTLRGLIVAVQSACMGPTTSSMQTKRSTTDLSAHKSKSRQNKNI